MDLKLTTMAKRYENKAEGKYYTEGECMKRVLPNGQGFIGTPDAEQLAEWGYTEVVEPVYEPTPYVPTYEELVVQKIRERYSIDDELAIQRQRATKPEEFAEYNSYCEQCKADAREELNYNESQEE